MFYTWNLWHGCRKISVGCLNCYVHRGDERYGRDSSKIYQTSDFNKIIKKKKNGDYIIPPKSFIGTCFTSDFFLKEADCWRKEAWDMIRERKDCFFFFITKRIDRFNECIPEDWNDGWDNVSIASTCENQDRLDYRMSFFKNAKIKHKSIVCEPLLGPINLEKYLDDTIEEVIVGGESGLEARVCDYEWVLAIKNQCLNQNIPFSFKQTGAHFLMNGKLYNIERKYQHSQARKAGINTKKRSINTIK